MPAKYLIPDDMLRPPSAIYLSKHRRETPFLSCALAFEGHEQVVKVVANPRNLFFEHCRPCVEFQEKRCPGGMHFLMKYDYGELYVEHPIRGDTTILKAPKNCVLRNSPNPPELHKQEFTVKTNIPSYVMAVPGNSDYINRWHMYFMETETHDENNPLSYWNVSPMPFPNVYGSGDICFGRNSIRNRYSFKELQTVFFSMIFNNDLFDSAAFKSPDPMSFLIDLSYEKAQSVLKDRFSPEYRARPSMLMGVSQDFVRHMAHRILPPIFKSVEVCPDTLRVLLTDKQNRVFYIANDLTGPIIPLTA